MLNIHIITTAVNEPQLINQKKQIAEFSTYYDSAILHTVINNYTAKEAMVKFYDLAKNCKFSDYILKLDGDMTFTDFGKFMYLIDILKSKKPNRLTVPVYDHVTNCSIYGCHFIRTSTVPNGVTITATKRDDWIAGLPGLTLTTKLKVIEHCERATEDQRYIFGYNRGHKLRHKKQNTLSTLWLLLLFSNDHNHQGIRGYVNGYYDDEYDFDYLRILKNKTIKPSLQNWQVSKIILKNPVIGVKALYQALLIKTNTPKV